MLGMNAAHKQQERFLRHLCIKMFVKLDQESLQSQYSRRVEAQIEHNARLSLHYPCFQNPSNASNHDRQSLVRRNGHLVAISA